MSVCKEFCYIRRDFLRYDRRLATFERNKLPPSAGNLPQNMDAACPPETSINCSRLYSVTSLTTALVVVSECVFSGTFDDAALSSS